ncbi:MAG: inositol 2-dehydrogenase [Gemmobacter sp.]
MLNIGLIGCGRIGALHARVIAAHPQARLTVVCDVHAPSAAAIAAQTGARVTQDAQAVFDAPDVDAVLVASLTETHADYIEAAVAAGRAVLCEKPIDLNLARVRRCEAAIAGSTVPVQIGFNRRFDPGHASLRAGVLAGEVGDTLQIIITSRDPAPPPLTYLARAGGMIRDMTIHDFDLARFLLAGDEVSTVHAVAGALIDADIARDPGDVDCAMVLMTTERGRQVFINNARQASYGYDQRLEVLGTAGMLQSGNRRAHEVLRFDGTSTNGGAPYLNFFTDRYDEAFRRQFDSFVSSVTSGTAPVVGFDDGMQALRLAEAAYAALARGGPVAVADI